MTLSEALVAAVVSTGLTAALLGVADPLHGMFDGQLELADMHQRLRSGVHAIQNDLLAAGVPILPYRAGARRHDPALGVFYRDDTITLTSASWEGSVVTSHTYYLRRSADASQLMHYDGVEADLPVLDHAVGLGFEYFDSAGAVLPPAGFQDGPWVPAGAAPAAAFDADLLAIRRVRVTLRVQAARAALRGPAGVLFTEGGTSTSMERYLPDREIRVEVALRNDGA